MAIDYSSIAYPDIVPGDTVFVPKEHCIHCGDFEKMAGLEYDQFRLVVGVYTGPWVGGSQERYLILKGRVFLQDLPEKNVSLWIKGTRNPQKYSFVFGLGLYPRTKNLDELRDLGMIVEDAPNQDYTLISTGFKLVEIFRGKDSDYERL